MRLLAISDLHLGDPVNRECFAGIGASPDDWLILAGDVSETEADLALAFGHLRSRFARVIWVPGNHELWTTDSTPGAIRGEARSQALVALAAQLRWSHAGGPLPDMARERSPAVHCAAVHAV